MKNFILIIIAAVSFTSCSTDDETQIDNSDIVGSWTWTSTKGGIAAQFNDTPESTGKSLQLQLNKDYSYTIVIDGDQISTGKYSLKKKKSIYSDEMERYITYSNDFQSSPVIITGIITSTGNELHIDDNYQDGLGSRYILTN